MSGLFRFLFILYCIEVGLFLVLVPWTVTWEQLMTPYIGCIDGVLVQPIVRGAVSGFGLVHVVWGAHDSFIWLRGRRSGDSLGT
ncbi:MAG: hypothetical protein VYE73_09035 [Acidobacteriota bacterium]|nr:hypothetical protein [Acidobacteriota bacterium]